MGPWTAPRLWGLIQTAAVTVTLIQKHELKLKVDLHNGNGNSETLRTLTSSVSNTFR